LREATAITIRAAFRVDDPMDRNLPTVRSDFRRSVKRRFDDAGITLAPPAAQSLSGEVTVRHGAVAAGE
jgi:small-conductance mechanosensitive channel